MKVSVIIAVYNTQNYLNECLDSLLQQTYTDWEAWCVNDGSTDESLHILHEYAQRDARFHVLSHSTNEGLAKSRNHALQHCQGDIISFLDSDDWFSPDALLEMVAVFKQYPQTDSVLYECQYVYDDRRESYPMPTFDTLTGKEAFTLSLNWQIHGVYAARTAIQKQYPYDETAKWYSDDNTTRLHYLASQEVRHCPGVYYYRQRSSSITHTIHIHHFDMMDANDSLRAQLHKLKMDDTTLRTYEEVRWRNLVDCYYYYYMNRSFFPKNQCQTIIDRIHRFWSEADYVRLPEKLITHLGYIPCKGHWQLFRLQEEFYFFLRGLFGKNRIK